MELRPLGGALGAEVHGVDLRGPISPAQRSDLRGALLDALVLIFPDQHLTADEHRNFGRLWGPLAVYPLDGQLDAEHPEMQVLDSDANQTADVWHSDLAFTPEPARYTIIQMLHCPIAGGDTLWASQCAVYDALSPSMQQLLESLTVIQRSSVGPERWAEHPAVRVHPESGRKSVNVNEHMTRGFPDLTRGESDALLTYLVALGTEPRFVFRHRWSAGTVAMWDNRGTQHTAVDDFQGRRTIRRVMVLGDRPEGTRPLRRRSSTFEHPAPCPM